MELNKKHKLPSRAKWKVVFIASLSLFLFLLISEVFFFMMFFIITPLVIYALLFLHLFSFVVQEDKITLNYGIIIKHSDTISFRNMQNVKNFRGIIDQLFGLSKVSIWTASPEQNHERKPDGRLILLRLDADWLKDFILSE